MRRRRPRNNNDRRKARVYCVTTGPRPGIYFVPPVGQSIAQSFESVAQAQRFLENEHNMTPLSQQAAGGWMSTKTAREPILFERPGANKDDVEEPSLKKQKSDTIQLDAHQQRAVDAALDGRNVFLTGVAGTGKSRVIQCIYEQLMRVHSRPGKHHCPIALAAPTGMAAAGLEPEAQTLHALAGMGVPQRASDFGRSPQKQFFWQQLQCLIVDEVGMVAADFMDWLDHQVRRWQKKPLLPFGGIQLIFVGDFCQLGPIPGNLSLNSPPPYEPTHAGADCLLQIRETTGFLFQSALWREANFCHVQLQTIYRQQQSEGEHGNLLVEALSDLRNQQPGSLKVQELVRQCETPLDQRNQDMPEGILPTVLYTNNRNVDRENAGKRVFGWIVVHAFARPSLIHPFFPSKERLAALPTEQKRFVATDSVSVDQEADSRSEKFLKKHKFFEQCQAPQVLDLKVGAQVMLVQNNRKHKLVNGSRGVVEKFRLVPVVRDFKNTEERLIGPDDTDLYPGYTFEQLKFGTTLEFENRHWKIFKFVRYPQVRFSKDQSLIMLPTKLERTVFRQGTCTRLQLPLRLAWALTIHKAQGCSIDWLICDLSGCFTAGQAYVALSRARTLRGLQIRNFSPRAVMTHPLVQGFYQALSEDTMNDFLRNQAGLWWYPLLNHPRWLRMFSEACGTPTAKQNSSQFQMWLANYRPSDNYQGWMGYSNERTKGRASSSARPSQQSPVPGVAFSARHHSGGRHGTVVTPPNVADAWASYEQGRLTGR